MINGWIFDKIFNITFNSARALLIYIFIKNDFERVQYIFSVEKIFKSFFVIKIFLRCSLTTFYYFIILTFMLLPNQNFSQKKILLTFDVLHRILKLNKKSIWIGCWNIVRYNVQFAFFNNKAINKTSFKL